MRLLRNTTPTSKPRVAIGIGEKNEEVIRSLQEVKDQAHLKAVAETNLPGLDTIATNHPEQKLVELLTSNDVDGIIRGTLDEQAVADAYEEETAINVYTEESVHQLSILRTKTGDEFCLYPLTNEFNWETERVYKGVTDIADYLNDEMGVQPRVEFLSSMREEEYDDFANSPENAQRQRILANYDRSEKLKNQVEKAGYHAANIGIEIETAIQHDYNILVPPDGRIGNQIFRSLVFLGGGSIVAGPKIGLDHYWEENSRNETDFSEHVKYIVQWIHSE